MKIYSYQYHKRFESSCGLKNHFPHSRLQSSETSDIDVALVIKLSEIPEDEFHSLNPSFNKPVILSNANQQILLPFGHAEIFQENLKKYTLPLSSWTAIRVSKTESVDMAAKTILVDWDAEF